MPLRGWIDSVRAYARRLSPTGAFAAEGPDGYVTIAVVAPYEVPVLDRVLTQGGIVARHVDVYDGATGQERVKLLVAPDQVDQSIDVLRQFRQAD